MDKDKVLQALNMCEGHDCHCDITHPKCPYLREDDKHANYGFPRCFEEMKKDILALLKEQEVVEPLTIDDAVGEIMDKHYKRLKEQEAKTGHWIYESQFADCWSNTCSECGKRFTNAIDSFAPYCWNCGAKMEGR